MERSFLFLLDGDMPAALILSRLLDLHQTGGTAEVKPQWKEAEVWWPLPWSWWRTETSIPERTARRALTKLKARGLVKTKQVLWRGGGTRLLWHLDLELLVKLWDSSLARQLLNRPKWPVQWSVKRPHIQNR